jgi:hypothetical protein
MGVPPSGATAALPERAPLLTLEISRGRTRFPQRPVSGARFFVGSGEACDLRLGGTDIPPLHSLIQIKGRQFWIEPVAPEPPLLINGQATQGEWLREGDVLSIGGFQFQTHLIPVSSLFTQRAVPSISSAVDLVLEDTDLDADATLDVSTLSASELVDRIEQEQARVEEFEANQRAGAEALLQTLRTRQAASAKRKPALPVQSINGRSFRWDAAHDSAGLHLPAETFPGTPGDAEYLHELERLSEELNEVSREFESRSMRISQRESSYVAAAEVLLEAQRHLVSQLEAIVLRVAELESRHTQPSSPTRASA